MNAWTSRCSAELPTRRTLRDVGALRALSLIAALAACSAGNDPTGGGGSGASGAGGSGAAGGAGGAGASGTGGFQTGGQGGTGGFLECAQFTAEATQAPAAVLIVLDKSASMTTNQKWSTAQLAVVAAIDNDAFDYMSLGLVAFPASYTTTPQCLCDYCCGGDTGLCDFAIPDGVSCGVSGLPQVAIADAGSQKSNEGGVRMGIYNYLVNNNPLNNADDGSPIYDAMVSGYNALSAYDIDKRILILVTDGGFSCTSVAAPARPGYSDGACNDWEYPNSVNALITQKRTDPNKPINTFIIGLPGSNSTGQMQGAFATAPYHMKRALSSYAYNGSPDTIDPACDVPDANFDVNGADPSMPCHIDLSAGGFDAQTLADALKKIRGDALGCVFELPDPPAGETIDPTKVNVDQTLDGDLIHLSKRANANDDCLDEGCWDYNDDGQIELIGKACSDLSAAGMAQVDIIVGCDTVVE